MLDSQLDDSFRIQPSRALLILEAENQLSQVPPEDSSLRRTADQNEWLIIWDTRKIPTDHQRVIFIARKTARFDSHNEVENLLNNGHLVIAEEQSLESLILNSGSKKSNWMSAIKSHPHLLLCRSSENARDIILRNICPVKESNWTTLAITGTNGKTSTTQIAGLLLQELSQQPVLRLGTLGIQVGSHTWKNPFPTMPDYPGLLAALREAQSAFTCNQMVMELPALDWKRTDWAGGLFIVRHI